MTNGTPPYLQQGAQQNGLAIQQIQLKNAFVNGQPEMAIAVPGSRPASYIGHVLLKLEIPLASNARATAQCSTQAVAIAQSLSLHIHAHSPTPQASGLTTETILSYVTAAHGGACARMKSLHRVRVHPNIILIVLDE